MNNEVAGSWLSTCSIGPEKVVTTRNVTLLNMAPKAMPGLGGKMSKSEEPERPPIDFDMHLNQ